MMDQDAMNLKHPRHQDNIFGALCALVTSSGSMLRQQRLIPHLLLPLFMLGIPHCTEDKPSEPPDGQDTTNVVNPGIDTTTHRYIWQSYTFGEIPSGSFYSVSAIDENNAYVVGDFYLNDTTSSSGGILKFNAVRWDGTGWNLKLISPHMPGIDTNYRAQPTLWSVWGEGVNNYTFSAGNLLVYDDGSSAVTEKYFYALQDSQSCAHILGNESDRWFFGAAGWITHGEGRHYSKQPRLTVARITGLCSNKDEVWAVAGYSGNADRAVLRYRHGQWNRMDDSTIAADIACTEDVWCDEIGYRKGGFVGLVGSNVCYYDSTWEVLPLKFLAIKKFFHAIHGTKKNNVFAVGTNGSVFHYNGRSWETYPELYRDEVYYNDVWATEKRVFIVGHIQIGPVFVLAYITVGTRVE